MSNKRKGDAFRDRICDLCIAAGYKPNIEVYVRGKKCDVAYEVFGQPRSKKVIVESKSLSGNLPKSMISEIIGDYTPALERRDVDEVWVIAELDFATEARAAPEERPGFFALSYNEFLRTLINFPQYLQYLKMEIENDGILEFYVPQRFVSKGNAISYLDNWLKSDRSEPIAVLSTYGMGKTSLAKFFAYRLVEKSITAPDERIPILIPLGALSSQQQIEGLLGTIFTSVVTIAGYNFPLFQKMNSLGHFVILFDGLDEMRHAMTWDDFRYNFDQLSKIILPRTKAVMFGRPNTFRNREEYEQIIHGIQYVSDTKVKPATSLAFTQVEIEPFTNEEVFEYLAKYISHLVSKSSVDVSANKIEARVQEINALNLDDLIARPVHAQMIANIASDFKTRLSSFSRAQLYDNFIEFVLKRDFDRSHGQGVPPAQRRAILRRLAWCVWFDIGTTSFQVGEIKTKEGVFGKSGKMEAREREILSGALLEAKLGENFYFSHRSFQEFLIAEAILSGERRLSRFVSAIGAFTDEIIDFVADSDNKDGLRGILNDLSHDVSSYGAELLLIAYKVFVRLVFMSALKAAPTEGALQNYCLGMRLLRLHDADTLSPELDRLLAMMKLRARFVSDERHYVLGMAFHFILLERAKRQDVRAMITANMVKMTLAASPLQKYLDRIRGTHRNVILYSRDDGPAAAVLRSAFAFSGTTRRDANVTIELTKVAAVLARGPGRIFVPDIEVPRTTVTLKLDLLGTSEDADLSTLEKMFNEARELSLKFVEAIVR